MAIVLTEKNLNDGLLITEATGRLGKRFRKDIRPYCYAAKEFEGLRKKDALMKEIVKDGISLL